MQEYRIVLGDWSDDGHGRTETHTVVIHGDVTQEQLVENYKRNIERVGFNPTDAIAAEYEEPTIQQKYVDKLIAAGFQDEPYDKESVWNSFNHFEGAYFVGAEHLIKIIMYFVLDGLNETSWEKLNPPKPPILIGDYRAVLSNEQYGYGLFS